MSDKAEDLGLELAAIVDASVTGVMDVELAAKVKQAKVLLEQLQDVFGEWLVAVQEEIGRQEEARAATLASVGLAASKASTGAGKRERKNKKGVKDSVSPEAEPAETATRTSVEAAIPLEALDAE